VNIVFGDGGDDTINLASLPGIATATPTFINGFSGDETISGAGMTGALYFNSGTGADTMTGGSGTNVYEFGAGAAGSAMDIITNFNAAADQIDLTWIGSRFSGVAALGPAANSIAANSVGWQTSGGNTFVYANTTARSEALSSANLKVELLGNVPLTGANFGHT
jgi:hypothetical protein